MTAAPEFRAASCTGADNSATPAPPSSRTASTGAGAGTVAYLRGELEATLSGNLAQTNKAVNRAVEELKFVRISETQDALLALTVVRNAADQRIEVRQDVVGEKLTRVRIRVGVFGDEKLSRTLLERIQAKL
jgi:hypothetical protein